MRGGLGVWGDRTRMVSIYRVCMQVVRVVVWLGYIRALIYLFN